MDDVDIDFTIVLPAFNEVELIGRVLSGLGDIDGRAISAGKLGVQPCGHFRAERFLGLAVVVGKDQCVSGTWQGRFGGRCRLKRLC